jgi:hypothetical protein
MAETMWHTVLQSQIIHPDWTAQEHMDFLDEEGFDTSTINYPRVDDCSTPLDVVQHWLDVNPTLPTFQREVERMGHFMKVALRDVKVGDEIINPGNDSSHKVEDVQVTGGYVYVRATAWVREGYVGLEKVLRVVKPSDVRAGTYQLPVGTTVRVQPTYGNCAYLGVVVGAVMNGPAGSLVKSYLIIPDGADRALDQVDPYWVTIHKAP